MKAVIKGILPSVVEAPLKKIYGRVYSQVNRLRALPDFVIIGAQKAGTTSLYNYLIQHPQILPARKKEIHYFDKYYQKGSLWYRADFPFKHKFNNGEVTGEASPFYLTHPYCPERISQTVPQAKLIVLLRNPVERTISHYFQNVRLERENLPIGEAVMQEEARLAPELEKLSNDEFYWSVPFHRLAYKMRGHYGEQLTKYFEYFDRNQFLILCSNTFFSDPIKVLAKIYSFLNVDPDYKSTDLRPKNVGTGKKKVPDDVVEFLNNYFLPRNKELYQLLERDFDW